MRHTRRNAAWDAEDEEERGRKAWIDAGAKTAVSDLLCVLLALCGFCVPSSTSE
jgi:hypothetical protein